MVCKILQTIGPHSSFWGYFGLSAIQAHGISLLRKTFSLGYFAAGKKLNRIFLSELVETQNVFEVGSTLWSFVKCRAGFTVSGG